MTGGFNRSPGKDGDTTGDAPEGVNITESQHNHFQTNGAEVATVSMTNKRLLLHSKAIESNERTLKIGFSLKAEWDSTQKSDKTATSK